MNETEKNELGFKYIIMTMNAKVHMHPQRWHPLKEGVCACVCVSLCVKRGGKKKVERATQREEPCHMHFKTLKFRKRKHNEFFLIKSPHFIVFNIATPLIPW